MRLLLFVDSRTTNIGGIYLLDLVNPERTRFYKHDFQENFKRLGFRGFAMNGGLAYAVNSAALYFFEMNFDNPGKPLARHVNTMRRPEWEVGERCAADLHHVHFSKSRNRLFIANSFMDCVDEVSLSGELLDRNYLWDICPEIMDLAWKRNPLAADLVHVNHIIENKGRLYLTLGNINGTREGWLLCYDTGRIILKDLEFPHDGIMVDGGFYVNNSASSKLYLYENVSDLESIQPDPDHILPVEIRQKEWQDKGQWIRGLNVTGNHIIVGANQFRIDRDGENAGSVPARLVFFNRSSKNFVGEVFLPREIPNPCIFTVAMLDDDDEDRLDFQAWPPPSPAESAVQYMEISLPDKLFREMDAAGNDFRFWTWTRDNLPISVKPEPDGTTFQVNLESTKDFVYLLSDRSPRSLTKPASNPEKRRLIPDGTVLLTMEVLKISAFLNLSLSLIEYDHERKLGVNTVKLRTGVNQLKVKAQGRAVSFRIGIRFSGRGRATFGKIEASQLKSLG